MTGGGAAYAVFGFDGTHEALQAETALLAVGLDVVLIPTPRALGSLCGFALRVPAQERADAEARLNDVGIDPNGVIELQERAR